MGTCACSSEKSCCNKHDEFSQEVSSDCPGHVPGLRIELPLAIDGSGGDFAQATAAPLPSPDCSECSEPDSLHSLHSLPSGEDQDLDLQDWPAQTAADDATTRAPTPVGAETTTEPANETKAGQADKGQITSTNLLPDDHPSAVPKESANQGGQAPAATEQPAPRSPPASALAPAAQGHTVPTSPPSAKESAEQSPQPSQFARNISQETSATTVHKTAGAVSLRLGFELPEEGALRTVDFVGRNPPWGLGFAKETPVRVCRVRPDGHAFKLGVQNGWILRSINGYSVDGVPFHKSMQLLANMAARAKRLEEQPVSSEPNGQQPQRKQKQQQQQQQQPPL